MNRISMTGLVCAVALWTGALSTGALSHGAGKLFAAESRIRIGVAKVDVTPTTPVVMAGYGSRSREFEGIDTKLWARAMVIGDSHPAAIVVIDNCGVTRGVTEQLASRVKKLGIGPDRLIVAATHTHNAPNLVGYASILWKGRTTPEQDKSTAEYTTFAIRQMESAIAKALADREPMTLGWAQGRATFGGNRRVLKNGSWAGFGFQRNGPVDHTLPLMAARDASGAIRAIWANYACHCTTAGSRNFIGGDWAGFANRSIEQHFPKAISLMTIGCGADVGPQPTGNLKYAQQHGESIAKEVQTLLAGQTRPLNVEPTIVSKRIKLPLVEPKPRSHWESQLRSTGFKHQLAKSMLEHLDKNGAIPSDVDYPLTVWKFGNELAMVFLAGEVVVDYSLRLKRELDSERLWITAWANDMPGYIPSRRVLVEGGYEAEFSQIYYGKPGPYATQVEDTLVHAVKELVGREFEASGR